MKFNAKKFAAAAAVVTLISTACLAAHTAKAQHQSPDTGIQAAGDTDKGRVRPQNEDSFKILHDARVYAVADGMGGHAAGEIASAIAVNTIQKYTQTPAWNLLNNILPNAHTHIILAAYHEANRNILKNALKNPQRQGMGTTLVSIVIQNDTVNIINLGDSRAYKIHENHISQISHDHSLVQELIDSGKLKTQQDIDDFPYKNIITRALGTHPKIKPDVFSAPLQKDDIYLLCSDGLTNEISNNDILKIITKYADNLANAAQMLIQTAKTNGGHDNITVIIVKV